MQAAKSFFMNLKIAAFSVGQKIILIVAGSPITLLTAVRIVLHYISLRFEILYFCSSPGSIKPFSSFLLYKTSKP
jgi:hypothetical protein